MNIHRSDLLTALAWLVPHETVVVLVRSVNTIQPCTMSLHAKSHTQLVHACLAVTCHLRFWQNDWDLLSSTAVIRVGYRNESAQKVDSGEENSPADPAGTRTRDPSITNPAL